MLKRIFKSVIAVLLIAASLLSLFGCKKEKYPPVESTEEENKIVMRLQYQDKTYEVKYELYRAFFLNYKSQVDGGDESVWSGDNKAEYINKINELITAKISYIYAALEVARQCGIDMYSKEVEKEIAEYVRASVEGDTSLGVDGYGDYNAYLAALKKENLNYQVQVLLYRYSIAIDKIQSYFIGNLTEDGKDIDTTSGQITYTVDDIKNFYYSDDCLRIMRAYINADHFTEDEAAERAERLREYIISAAASGEREVALTIVQNSTSSMADVEKGVIARYNLNEMYYADLTAAAFALEENGVSEIIEISDNLGKGLYILYRAEKNDAHFEKYYNYITYTYLTNIIGGMHSGVSMLLNMSASFTSEYNSIVHSAISMG